MLSPSGNYRHQLELTNQKTIKTLCFHISVDKQDANSKLYLQTNTHRKSENFVQFYINIFWPDTHISHLFLVTTHSIPSMFVITTQ